MIKVEREAMSASSAAQVDKMTQGVLLGCTLHLRLCLPNKLHTVQPGSGT